MLINFEDVQLAILSSFKEAKVTPLQSLLIGSLAKGNAHSRSDADIIVCFKKKNLPNNDTIYNLLEILEEKIGRNVDLIIFEYKNKFVNHDQRDIHFLENAITEAKQIDNNSEIGKELIDFSTKIGLYKFR